MYATLSSDMKGTTRAGNRFHMTEAANETSRQKQASASAAGGDAFLRPRSLEKVYRAQSMIENILIKFRNIQHTP
jgi:hypothetical protein